MAVVSLGPPKEDVYRVDGEALLSAEARELVRADPETGVPGQLRGLVVSSDPKITVIPQFLGEAECEHLRDLADGCWIPSTVGRRSKQEGQRPGDDSRLKNSRSRTRTSSSCLLRHSQTHVVEVIQHRLAQLAKLPVDQIEPLNMVRYFPGEHFNEHHDGKFRPRTVFVYLNDLPEDDEGETYFSQLGIKFVPRRGCAVMWTNPDATGKEDSRVVHNGLAPLTGTKYGVNCFFNEKAVRHMLPTLVSLDAAECNLVDVRELAAAQGTQGDAPEALAVYVMSQQPRLATMPKLLSEDQVHDLLAPAANAPQVEHDGPYFRREGSATLHIYEYAENDTVAYVEAVMSSLCKVPVSKLARLRIVRPGGRRGCCNRGCGTVTALVALSAEDTVVFPRLGLSVLLRAGDALCMSNTVADPAYGFVQEDLRAERFHTDGGRALALEAYFHNVDIRVEQSTASEAREE